MTAPAPSADQKATRPWRLRGYVAEAPGSKKYSKLQHQSLCRGDAALDEAMKQLEANPAIGRITVESA